MQRYAVQQVPNLHPLTSEDGHRFICSCQDALAGIDDAKEEESHAVHGKQRGRKELMEEY